LEEALDLSSDRILNEGMSKDNVIFRAIGDNLVEYCT